MNNWITKFIKPGLKTLLKKVRPKPGEDSSWITCGGCQQLIYKEELYKNFFICPKCNEYQKIAPQIRFGFFFDNGKFEILKPPLLPDDPINFIDTKKYIDRLATARKITGQDDAIMIAKGKLKDINVTVGAQNFAFIGGSAGTQSGEAFIYGSQHAIDKQTPYIFFTCSGGMRMQEGSLALSNMSRFVVAINELKKNNLPYIVVLTNPSTGGTLASLGMLGDIIFAEPKATAGFASARVIQQTIGESLPEGFQTSEYLLDHGGIDKIVARKDLREEIGNLITILLKKNKSTSIEAENEDQKDTEQIASFAS